MKTFFETDETPGAATPTITGAPNPTMPADSTWWSQLIQQIPEIVGIVVKKPGDPSGGTQYIGQQPTQPQSMFTPQNIIYAAIAVIIILVVYKLILK